MEPVRPDGDSSIPPDYYNEKTNVMIAAGDSANLMLIGNPYQFDDETFRSIANDLTDMLERFPRLKVLAVSDSPSTRRIPCSSNFRPIASLSVLIRSVH